MNLPSHARHPANRLARETSPYLLQHAHNPVDWWPWSPEAFAEARRRDVPIFLSIGYSTCYWCHVMERESFENAAIGAQMNDHFVCIKVDREERPDVDDIYMAAVQAFSGGGGWPMSVFLEPKSLKPFWAGTYFPAEPRFQNTPTFPDVLSGIAGAWHDHRRDVLAQAEDLADAVRERLSLAARPVLIGDAQVIAAVGALLRVFDRNHGGFGGAPKFPQPVNLELLLDARRASADDGTTAAIDAAIRTTLDKMAIGGVFDQVGGGFHRYSVDATWTVPHFEKMLYDNAQLAEVYAKASVVYSDGFYADIARRILLYVRREMTDPATGACYSAQDAEVRGREGLNYLWTRDQLIETLGRDDGEWAAAVYGVIRGPNFRDPHHTPAPGEVAGNVLRLNDRPERVAAAMRMDSAEFGARLVRVNAALLAARDTREQPRLDDKTIASWNGLMIAAMATCGVLLDEPEAIRSAVRAMEFVLTRMREVGPEMRRAGLLRSFRAGIARTPAFLEDYALVIRGLIELHRTGSDPSGRFLLAAEELCELAAERFCDDQGNWFDTPANQADLFVRTSSWHDGAIPSASGLMLRNLASLAEITGKPSYRSRAIRGLVSSSAMIAAAPLGAVSATRALMSVLSTDRHALDDALSAAQAADRTTPREVSDAPVEILASADRVELSAERKAALTLRVRIADGFHLTAADPGGTRRTTGLMPFRVQVVDGGGLKVYADYPKGQPYGADRDLLVYTGTFDLPLLLERSGPWTGRPILAVTYQPCTDEACLASKTVELDVALDAK
ncbi:MAG: thioredoxin domain-containing protein [Phycisphaerales bacterium]|nr:thioredoxin domain-containing protein [Phycisphaerales bacterium]